MTGRPRKPLTGPDDPRHGTATAYEHHGCRCDRCAAGTRERHALLRARRRAEGLPEGDPRHGTPNGYTNWGCRCETCVANYVTVNARGRARRKAARDDN